MAVAETDFVENRVPAHNKRGEHKPRGRWDVPHQGELLVLLVMTEGLFLGLFMGGHCRYRGSEIFLRRWDISNGASDVFFSPHVHPSSSCGAK